MPHTGQAGINQLGGIFVNGRPLPAVIRHRIVELAEIGVRPCDISRQLLVSHGCVSKILSRYYETGSISPGATDGQKRRPLPYLVSRKILQFKHENPSIGAKEVRLLLILYRVFTDLTAPSTGAINRVLRSTVSMDQLDNSHKAMAKASGVQIPKSVKAEAVKLVPTIEHDTLSVKVTVSDNDH